jgi:hypothetical protein
VAGKAAGRGRKAKVNDTWGHERIISPNRLGVKPLERAELSVTGMPREKRGDEQAYPNVGFPTRYTAQQPTTGFEPWRALCRQNDTGELHFRVLEQRTKASFSLGRCLRPPLWQSS